MTNPREALEEASITASCGHKVQSVDDLVDVEFTEEVIDYDLGRFVEATVYAVYCPDCAACLKARENSDG
jgi:hypothetical protein